MDTGGCVHRVVDPTAATPVGAKRRPDLTDGWTGTKKSKTPCSHEYQALGLEGGGSGEANSTAAVVRSRKRPLELSELELAVAADPDKMFKCNYWEDPAYEKTLQYFGLKLARSVALDNSCDRLISSREQERMARAAAAPRSATDYSSLSFY